LIIDSFSVKKPGAKGLDARKGRRGTWEKGGGVSFSSEKRGQKTEIKFFKLLNATERKGKRFTQASKGKI